MNSFCELHSVCEDTQAPLIGQIILKRFAERTGLPSEAPQQLGAPQLHAPCCRWASRAVIKLPLSKHIKAVSWRCCGRAVCLCTAKPGRRKKSSQCHWHAYTQECTHALEHPTHTQGFFCSQTAVLPKAVSQKKVQLPIYWSQPYVLFRKMKMSEEMLTCVK